MEWKRVFSILGLCILFFYAFLFNPGYAGTGVMPEADAITGDGEGVSDHIASASPGDTVFEKVSLPLNCHYHWTPLILTVDCTDGTNTFSADYEVAYINTDVTNSKTDQVMAHVLGPFQSNINGVQRVGLSSGFFTGTAHVDKDGAVTSTSLTINLYGGINNDSVFQMSAKVTLTPPF